MRAILVTSPGGPEALSLETVADLPVGPRDIRILVAAAGVNRADVAQRQGSYPSPAGAPQWPGLEVSGTVTEVGAEATLFAIGDRVCALLPGGGYATEAVVHEELALPVPDAVDLVDAAALPEALATVWSNVFLSAGLAAGETLLVHGGGSGIGTTAIQLARLAGARVAVTAGSAEKLAVCASLGAEILINYRDQDFVAEIKAATDGHGADVILDILGGSYAARNVAALAVDGRIMVIGNQSGEDAVFNPFHLMQKRGRYWGTTLRARPFAEKAAIMRALRADVWPWLETASLRPVIDSRFSFAEAAAAHRRMEASAHVGKIVLVP
ncbi:NAD(P)H-quinone oxidoreductase [Cryobacterium psychrophilum]|uniref:NAD(P)H-quinone oxidoreductase n=1 Tax=Cryobacterium psychrophilum TaxID=41988 RepID=A0A4Y8KPH0_9MICO|nr:NAD(P)H-quinone oxidoreductase [Cryobacterium psychrophilum]TDW31077.1 putative PIG3 family NAD(P)H quinone oxidoreductase [Cryobacterium psychrophilum]TFD78622.1 NAD(P)H-quinone oxidoreductase [Cryobacterium psychrophilum]